MVRLGALVTFATLLVSGLASPLSDPVTIENALNNVGDHIDSVTAAARTFQANPNNQAYAMDVHTQTWNFVVSVHAATQVLTGPVVSEAEAARLLEMLQSSGAGQMLDEIIAIKSAFVDYSVGTITLLHGDLVQLLTETTAFYGALILIFPPDFQGQVGIFANEAKQKVTLAIAAYATSSA